MLDITVAPSWINFHSETKEETLWSIKYFSNDFNHIFLLNGEPCTDRTYESLFPVTSEKLDSVGKGLVLYFKTLDSKYQNVSYYYSLFLTPNGIPIEFSLSIVWTHEVIVYDVVRLAFVVFCNIAVLILCMLLFRFRDKSKESALK
jgi:hypothetical protein